VKRNPGQAWRHEPGFRWRSIRATLAGMSKKFIDIGAEVYVDRAAVVKEANKAL
jgi:hypothetical protein